MERDDDAEEGEIDTALEEGEAAPEVSDEPNTSHRISLSITDSRVDVDSFIAHIKQGVPNASITRDKDSRVLRVDLPSSQTVQTTLSHCQSFARLYCAKSSSEEDSSKCYRVLSIKRIRPRYEEGNNNMSEFTFISEELFSGPVSQWCEHKSFAEQTQDYRRLVARFGLTNRYLLIRQLPRELSNERSLERFLRQTAQIEPGKDYVMELLSPEDVSALGGDLWAAHLTLKTKKAAQTAAWKIQENISGLDIRLELAGPRQPALTLWVGNVREYMAQEPLASAFANMFSAFGNVARLRMMPERSCAFVEYSNTDHAKLARNHLHGFSFGPPGRQLLLNLDFSAADSTLQGHSTSNSKSCIFCQPSLERIPTESTSAATVPPAKPSADTVVDEAKQPRRPRNRKKKKDTSSTSSWSLSSSESARVRRRQSSPRRPKQSKSKKRPPSSRKRKQQTAPQMPSKKAAMAAVKAVVIERQLLKQGVPVCTLTCTLANDGPRFDP